MAVTHTFVSAVADVADTSLVRPSNWNADHTVGDGSFVAAKLSATATDVIFGRSSAGAGNGEEIACTSAGRSILDDASTGAIRTTLGVGTGDSPEFTGVNVGDASDTTVSRIRAGRIGVEGQLVIVEEDIAGYIRGCESNWRSANSISIGLGTYHSEGLDTIMTITADTTATATVGTSAWGYVYAYAASANATPSVIVSTTAPAAPYAGWARSASASIGGNAANLHRFMGVVKSDASNNIRPYYFNADSGQHVWTQLCGNTSFGRVLSAGSATVWTDVSAAIAIPPLGEQIGFVRVISTAQNMFFGTTRETTAGGSDLAQSLGAVSSGNTFTTAIPADSSQNISYCMDAGSGAGYFDIYGFWLKR